MQRRGIMSFSTTFAPLSYVTVAFVFHEPHINNVSRTHGLTTLTSIMDAFNAHKLEPTHLAIATATLLLLLSLRKYVSRLKQTHSLPPGPPKLPLIGNLLDLPTEQEWRVYARWGELYGRSNYTKALLCVTRG